MPENRTAIKKIEIINALLYMPENEVDKIKDYIYSDYFNTLRKKRGSLKGCWKDKGFENIGIFDVELKEARKDIEINILKRQL